MCEAIKWHINNLENSHTIHRRNEPVKEYYKDKNRLEGDPNHVIEMIGIDHLQENHIMKDKTKKMMSFDWTSALL